MISFLNCMGPGGNNARVPGATPDSIYLSYDHNIVPYKFYKPDTTFKLVKDLDEISGLTAISNDKLAAIGDEEGILYLINAHDGSVIRKIEFSDGADYESLEFFNNRFYVLESDGDVYQFDMTQDNKADTKKDETVFERSNDLEGMGLQNGKFLIACKSDGDIHGNKVKGKAVYIMDPETLKVQKKEFISVTEDDLEDVINKRNSEVNITDFDPSAIAVSPVDGRIYLLSADMILGVFSPKGKLEEVVLLMKNMYRQPEGICFTPDGTLYISAEANGSKPQLFRFSRIKK